MTLTLEGYLLSLSGVVSTTFVSDYIFSSAMSFMVGFVFFGGPVIERMVRMLDKNVPGWQEKIELRKCVGSRLLSLPFSKRSS